MTHRRQDDPHHDQHPDQHHDQHEESDSRGNSRDHGRHEAKMYARFGLMIATSTLVMFALTYTNAFSADHVRFSEERVYMALLMGAAMALVMSGLVFAFTAESTNAPPDALTFGRDGAYQIAVGALNLFDQEPPAAAFTGYLPALHDVLGRQAYVRASVAF